MARARGTGGGCIALVAVLIAAAIGVALLAFMLFSRARVVHNVELLEPPGVEENGGGTVVFSHGTRPVLTLPGDGQPVTLEQYVAYLNDDRATKLARESFRQAADQARVRWLLRNRDISGRDGRLYGEFEVPWRILHDHGSSGGSVHMACAFVETSREDLMGLRRGDWVTVDGTLVFDGERARINEARIVSEAAPPVVEEPES